MNVLFTIVVTFFAGMGAGLGTGFAGMSAAAVISPMLITFLGMDPYMAVGIALSSDVLASAVSAYTYHKNKNLDVKNGLIMMASVLLFTVVGSYIASLLPSATMGSFSVFMTFLLGIKFIVRPVMTTKEAMQGVSAKKRAVQSIVCGVIIGLICGFVGAGGGMMMLLILTSVLGYELKTAVGTSVFIMAFTALTIRLVPRRSAPSFTKSSASCRLAMPPAALIFLPLVMCAAMRATSSRVAPPPPKPVEVLI